MTAGPDEQQLLQVVPDMVEDPAAPDADEQAVKERLMRMTTPPPPMPAYPPAVPAPPADDGGDVEDEAGLLDWLNAKRAARAAQLAHDPDAPEPADADAGDVQARAANDRLPDWRDPHKPHLVNLDDDQDDDQGDSADEAEAADEVEDEDEVEADGTKRTRAALTRNLSSLLKKTDSTDTGEEPTGPRWSRPALGRPPGLPEEKHNLFTWWAGIEPYQKWLLYHGTGLAGGIWLGAFDSGFRGAEYVKTHDPDDLNTIATYGMGVIWLALDYRFRNTFPPIAWAIRGVTTAAALGAVWHSTPLANLAH
ncbi:hypothetical protein B0E38_07757 [Streptomyces sp. 111WW2]|uniref:hypothetical protein n=1 Tax=Streptomyces sp. 111WW2 TaxID=1945515 RepID=UPI000D0C7E44|nr:hypothetical protein [Streptomyces sp. 111WW2]PSK43952.1 hypothetical protein B0E38_07757 [Streptomyces sp. 111WW2]